MSDPETRDKRGTVPRFTRPAPSLWITSQAVYQELFIMFPDFLDSRASTPRGTVPRVPRLSRVSVGGVR
jgi:hypothetical protein